MPLLDLVSLMQLPLSFCIGCVLDMQMIFCIELICLHVRMFILVWMIIVITIYSDCSCLVKPCFIAIVVTTWSHYACSICISRFLLTMIILCYCFQENLSVWFKSFIVSRVRCEWVLVIVPNSHFKSRVCFRVLSRNSQRGRL